jgi:hypothetical protein
VLTVKGLVYRDRSMAENKASGAVCFGLGKLVQTDSTK